tara:strand:- start:3559 stop:4983 length:1425 start_codon:yes stop_codon:yes gene_type:complete
VQPPKDILSSIDFERSKADWLNNNDKLIHANEAVGNSIMLNRFNDPSINEAAKFVLTNENASQIARTMANDYIFYSQGGVEPTPETYLPQATPAYFKIISNIKKQLIEYPKNYIKWAELSFFYATIGQTEKAEKCMDIAISGNSENRFILLSASRYFMHSENQDRALYYLRKAANKLTDPWVISAEIAISDTLGLGPKTYKQGNLLLESDKITDFHKSELASAIGTIESKSGLIKSARKYMRTALINPTENSIAQAVFLAPNLGVFDLGQSLLNSKVSFEAESRLSFQAGKYRESLELVKKWLKFQPFSSRPAIMGSYIASVALGDFEEGINIAKIGLLTSPHEFMLLNNLAFSLISLDRLPEAEEVLNRMPSTIQIKAESAVFLATQGAFEFRSNRIERGRELYQESISIFTELKDEVSKALATYFWKREESRVKDDSWIDKVNYELNQLLKKTGLDEVKLFVNENEKKPQSE